jgi:2-keto-4-pentenoate hydratase/2-oxohepta-3-ene-1,7-dioic acid hydratase in catechol pathway
VKFVRLQTDDIAYGVVEADGIRAYRGTPFVAWEPTETIFSFDEVRLLAPVFPTKIVAVGRNYADHVAEMGAKLPDEPLIFLKPATAVIGPGDAVRYPPESSEVHHEAELALVIGKVASKVAVEDALSHVLGYTAANDVTARDLQRSDGQWTRAKGFDTFCPLGPAVETEFDPREGAVIIGRVNGEVRQEATTADLIFGVPELVAYISAVMTLLPGDVILTGTPEGVGPVQPGDVMEVEIEGIGTLRNPVAS